MLRPLIAIFSLSLAYQFHASAAALKWRQLPNIPDRLGFAGSFSGVSGGALVVAGGANFPEGMPWEGGRKVWYDSVYVLPQPVGHWLSGFKLPHPGAYGVSVSFNDAVICAGGSDATHHYRDVFRLSWHHGELQTDLLPDLPQPMANGCGALVRKTLYIAGGIASPDATNSLKTFWALDLSNAHPQWRELPSWPGAARMLAVAAAFEDSFFIFSGVELSADTQRKPVRRYLNDAYAYRPKSGWRRLADLPRPCSAAPSPAIHSHGTLLIVSGDDGDFVNFEPKSEHPGFPKNILAYDLKKDEWQVWNDAPISRATASVTQWKDLAVIPSGEVRPGQRTPEVWGFSSR